MTNGAGTNTATYMYKDYTTNYDTIPVTSAKLHNGSRYVGTDEEYTTTDDATAGSTYYWDTSDSMWKLQGASETITITFDANGGEGTMDAQTTESGTDTVLTVNVFTMRVIPSPAGIPLRTAPAQLMPMALPST